MHSRDAGPPPAPAPAQRGQRRLPTPASDVPDTPDAGPTSPAGGATGQGNPAGRRAQPRERGARHHEA